MEHTAVDTIQWPLPRSKYRECHYYNIRPVLCLRRLLEPYPQSLEFGYKQTCCFKGFVKPGHQPAECFYYNVEPRRVGVYSSL